MISVNQVVVVFGNDEITIHAFACFDAPCPVILGALNTMPATAF
jgi:hypothetical protein